jgi:hypothetical protein
MKTVKRLINQVARTGNNSETGTTASELMSYEFLNDILEGLNCSYLAVMHNLARQGR